MTVLRQCFFILTWFVLSFLLIYEIPSTRAAEPDFIHTPWRESEYPFVVELFTSIDCPGCGLSDSILYKISSEENVIALGCHIGYLRNPPWTVSKSEEECTNKQWFYSTSRWTGNAELVTPQWIVNGKSIFQGLDRVRIYDQLRIASQYTIKPAWAKIEKIDDQHLKLILPNGKDHELRKGESHGIWLIRYQNSKIIKIPVSEDNPKARVARYTNTVIASKHVGRWYGEARELVVNLDLFNPEDTKETGGWVVLVQKTNGEEIVAAGILKDPIPPRKTGVTPTAQTNAPTPEPAEQTAP